METSQKTLQMPTAQPAEALKSFLGLLGAAKQAAASGPAGGNGQICAELAYKLAQASGQSSDPNLLKNSICDLLDALDGLRRALSNHK